MSNISRREAFGALASLAITRCCLADTFREVKISCQICEQQYEAKLTASQTQFGQRLDLRPIGALASPPRIPVCPKCGFVDFLDGKEYPKDELKAIREFVLSDKYKKLVKSEQPYFRLAKIDELLKRPQSQIAYRCLQASWQAEDHEQKELLQAYLLASLNAYEKVIADKNEEAKQRQVARIVKGEILRRLGKFEDAAKHFEAIRKLDDSKAEPFPRIIEMQIEYIGKKDDKPHEIVRSKSE